MYEQIRNLMNGFLPVIGGVFLTLVAYGVIGRKRKLADPDLDSVLDDSLKVLRIGGPALILIGIYIVVHVLRS